MEQKKLNNVKEKLEEREFKEKFLFIERTKKGFPVILTGNKVYTNLERRIFLFNKEGNEKNDGIDKFMRYKLVFIDEGDYIVKVYKEDNKVGITIFKILEIAKKGNKCKVNIVVRKSPDENTIFILKGLNENEKKLLLGIYSKVKI